MKVIIAALLLLNLLFSGYLFVRIRNLPAVTQTSGGEYIIKQEKADLSAYVTKAYVDGLFASIPEDSATATPSPAATSKAATVATPVPQINTSYLPIGGSLATTNTDWTDVPGSEFWADFNSDFGSSATVSWEATLKVAAGSGRVTARLLDSTHGIELLESQIQSESGSFVAVTSGRIYPWAGKNLYKVQIKSLSSTEASFGGGKVKVVY